MIYDTAEKATNLQRYKAVIVAFQKNGCHWKHAHKHHIKPKSLYPELENDYKNIVKVPDIVHWALHEWLLRHYAETGNTNGIEKMKYVDLETYINSDKKSEIEFDFSRKDEILDYIFKSALLYGAELNERSMLYTHQLNPDFLRTTEKMLLLYSSVKKGPTYKFLTQINNPEIMSLAERISNTPADGWKYLIHMKTENLENLKIAAKKNGMRICRSIRKCNPEPVIADIEYIDRPIKPDMPPCSKDYETWNYSSRLYYIRKWCASLFGRRKIDELDINGNELDGIIDEFYPDKELKKFRAEKILEQFRELADADIDDI